MLGQARPSLARKGSEEATGGRGCSAEDCLSSKLKDKYQSFTQDG